MMLNHRPTALATALALVFAGNSFAQNAVNPIKLDQFGYLPHAPKIAQFSKAVQGFNQAQAFAPGNIVELRRQEDDGVALSISPQPWREGAVDSASGDQVWSLDFSSVTSPGSYYLVDLDSGVRSEVFEISATVYQDVLKQAVRSFFYQRSGYEKQPPYADPAWVDAASHLGDAQITLIDPNNPGRVIEGSERDLSGGWFDAGDFNKYVNYADGALHDLLYAYQENPQAWGDDANIPESGNGIPDLLDEVRWELDWLLRMQTEDGSLLHKVSGLWHEAAIPSQDFVPRRYAPATASATISAAGALAHAALVYTDIDSDYAATLLNAALKAWNWLEQNPSAIPSRYGYEGFTGFHSALAEDCINDDCNTPQKSNRVAAAIYLLAASSEPRFAQYILEHTQAGQSDIPFLDRLDTAYLWDDGIYVEVQDALLLYTQLEQADAALVERIINSYSDAIARELAWDVFAPLSRFKDASDPYRAWLDADEYHWGSNRAKAHAGNILLSAHRYLPTISDDDDAVAAALGYVHYLHGSNPLGLCYLSNMGGFGAEQSIDEIYHQWFSDGSVFDNVNEGVGPVPGFLVGGPNPRWPIGSSDATATQLHNSVTIDGEALLSQQPPTKFYKAWNTGDEWSWEINENSITYQAPYIRLLSKFVADVDLNITPETPVDESDSQADDNPEQADWTPPGAVALEVTVNINAQWDGGFCASFEISTPADINHWDLALLLPGDSYGIWGVNSTDLGDSAWKIEPVIWNHLIFAQQSKSFDACASGDPANIRISDAYGYTYEVQMAETFGDLMVDAWFTGIYDNSYCMNVNITNLSNAAKTWSEVRLQLPDSQFDLGWSADFAMQGTELVISAQDWNQNLALGGDTTVGFCADGYNNVSLSAAH